MNAEPVVSYAIEERKFHVYRDGGGRLEYIDAVMATDAAGAALRAVKRHHDWRNDGAEWRAIIVPADALTAVTVTFEPQARVA